MSSDWTQSTSLVARLHNHAMTAGDDIALVFADDGGQQHPVTVGELDERARAVAAGLAHSGAEPGSTAMIIHDPGIEYVTAFLGCLYSGVIAVPVPPAASARGRERLGLVALDSEAPIALTDSPAELLPPGTRAIRTADLRQSAAGAPEHAADAVAFLQYTSGSTGTPKGVRITHGNLAHNSAVIATVLDVGPDTRGVSWLPPFHDMGLIGGILQPLYSGFPCLLMAPSTFLHRPLRWLTAIAEFGATVSPAPDFGYAECVRRVPAEIAGDLDLSRWTHALVGAERVRPATLDAFAERFRTAGFQPSAFVPCYGLAEATLYVTGSVGQVPSVRRLDVDALARGTAIDSVDGIPVVSCGQPVAGVEVAVVDPDSARKVDDGVVGEVWVAGASVAAGYRTAEASAATFGATMAEDSEQLWLRTGDLGFLDDTGLSVVSRLKDLLIVRGVNHAPEDLEYTAAGADPALIAGRGAAFSIDTSTGQRLVLVFEAKDSAGPDTVAAVAAAVAVTHGLAFDEVVLVRRGGVPVTSSGKVRRSACRDRYRAGTLPRLAATAPASTGRPPTALLEDIAAAMDRPASTLDPDQPLVEQGLDSLRSVRLRDILHRDHGIEIKIVELMAGLSVADLAAWRTAVTADPIPQANQPVLASPGQERLYLLDELGAGSAYHLGGRFALAPGTDIDTIRVALRSLTARHDALRSGITRNTFGDLTVHLTEATDIPVSEISAADLVEWADAPFQWDAPPLVRAALTEDPDGNPALALCLHHAIADGWSFAILTRDLAAALNGESELAEPNRTQHADAAAWLRTQAVTDSELDFWREYLHDATPPELGAFPTDGATPFAGTVLPIEIAPPIVDKLRKLAASERTSLFVVLTAAWSTMLSRRSGTTDLVIGTLGDGRTHPDLADVVGLFASILPLRANLTGTSTPRERIRKVRESTLAAMRHSSTPFDRIVRATGADRDSGGRPLVKHLLVLQDQTPGGAQRLPNSGARFDLELDLAPTGTGGLSGTVTAADAVIDPDTARHLLADFAVLLTTAADAPDEPLESVPASTDAQLAQLARFGIAAAPPQTTDVSRSFAEIAREYPDTVAIIGIDGAQHSYGKLDRAVSDLHARLSATGARRGNHIAVLLDRGFELSVAVLAILAAGCVYVPIDPDLPTARLTETVCLAEPVAVLTTADLAHSLTTSPAPLLLLDSDSDSDSASKPPTAPLLDPTDPAYAIFTSGSTGRPKLVVNTRAGLANRLTWGRDSGHVGFGDRVLHKTPISFDVSIWELLLPLVCGATVVHARPHGHLDASYLHKLLDEHAVTVCHFVPSMARAFLNEPSGPHTALRRIICSGEALTAELARRLAGRFQGIEIVNLYGPTEAAIEVTIEQVTDPIPDRMPIGRPAPGVETFVLSTRMQPAPIGVTGELYLGGDQLALGYHADPARTATRFVAHPSRAGARIYATGDRVRWLPDGRIEYLSRLDRQLKLHGRRIEPAEIESVLETHPAVSSAAVIAHKDANGEITLAAYVVALAATDAARLRTHLLQRLPAGMVPRAFAFVPQLARLSSGKIDRAALPDIAAEADRQSFRHPPSTVLQHAIAQAWREVMVVDEVAIDDEFFSTGGHSLIAARLLARIHTETGAKLRVTDLLSGHATVATVARAAEEYLLTHVDDAELGPLLNALDALTDDQVEQTLEHASASRTNPVPA